MAEKPKQKSKTKLTDKEQSERFKQTARQLGIEENKDFESVIKKILPPKRKASAPSGD